MSTQNLVSENKNGPASAENTNQANFQDTTAIVQKTQAEGHWIVKYASQIADFGPGAEGQRKAYQMLITVNRPDVADLVLKMIQRNEIEELISRAWRGAKLAIEGAVTLLEPGLITVGHVQSSGSKQNPDGYLIQQPDALTCSCGDFQFDSAPIIALAGHEQKMCKHIAAFLIAYKSGDAKKASRRYGTQPAEEKPAAAPAANGNGHGRIFANGQPCPEELAWSFDDFTTKMRIQPFNEQKLTDWVKVQR